MQKAFIYKFDAMSTPCELILYSHNKLEANAAAEAVLIETKRLEKKYNYYNPDSYLSRLNRRETDKLDQESKTLIQRALKYEKLTSGHFDITIATFKPLFTRHLSLTALEKEKAVLLPFTGGKHLRIKKDRLLFDNPHTMIDLGGFVKEYAVDRAILQLKKKHFSSALVNFGGDIFALGSKPDGTPFVVAIKDPDHPDQAICEVALNNQALTTSASYERNYRIEDHTFSHILSKKSPKKVPKSVSVISHNCVESGVYSTALMIESTVICHHKVLIF